MERLPPISTLMSPPETELIQSFDTPTKPPQLHTMASMDSPMPKMNFIRAVRKSPEPETTRQPPSPPESPAVQLQRGNYHGLPPPPQPVEEDLRDPLLYPTATSEVSAAPSPDSGSALFPAATEQEKEIETAIEKHIRNNAGRFVKRKSKGISKADTSDEPYEMPSRDDYRLAASLVSTVGYNYNQDPLAYFKYIQAENAKYYPLSRRLGARPYHTTRPAKQPKLPIARLSTSKVVKKTAAPKAPRIAKKPATSQLPATQTTTPPQNAPRTPKAPSHSRVRAEGATPTRVREPKKPIDYNFAALPDYSPPSSVLDNNPKALKVDWEGSALDLSNDPHRELLHET
jgi:hypothetical protein